MLNFMFRLYLLLVFVLVISMPLDVFSSIDDIAKAYDNFLKDTGKICNSHSECKNNTICMKISKDEGHCTVKPSLATGILDLPFEAGHEVVCTQSWGNLKGTHGWRSAYFSIDLATPYKKASGKVRAVQSGIAKIYTQCKDPKGTPEKSEWNKCGMGLGNNVRIFHANGLMSLYAHLHKILIKDGQKIKKGEIIGIEGATGAAGHRHLHWDIQKIPGGEKIVQEVMQSESLNGVSIPFKFRIKSNGKTKILDSSEIHCKWDDMSQEKWIAP